jgi:hypothetical protein
MSIPPSHPVTVETDRYLATVTAAAALGCGDNYPHLDTDFIALLGGPYWNATTWTTAWSKVATGDLVVVQAALPRLIGIVNLVGIDNAHVADVCTLVAALYDAGRWRDCLADVSSAYALAASICLIVATQADSSSDGENTDEVQPALIAILNDWLDCEYAWPGPRYDVDVAERLFGSAWCEVAMSKVGGDASTTDFCALIGRDRPPFLPGLCPAQELDLGIDLPPGMG